MIPILFDYDEVSFTTNGLGRLRDCISCKVTEERNGVYECDFEYPVNGTHFNSIKCGRIIGVTHADSEDIQPFDIVSYSKPIDGIVTFHCTHISYRQSLLTVKTPNPINSLADAFTLLESSTPANPFIYQTDKTSSTGYLGAANGIPRTVRQILGGIEGSILDVYGGEYEFDKWNVNLWSSRGQLRDFTIRYGVNMTTFNDETDINGTYSSCIPYWTNGEETVVANKVDSGGTTVTGRGECVPLDLSEYFENKPTTAQLQTKASSMMINRTPFFPTQTIEVSFVRLQDLGFDDLSNLYQCKLCDSINVIFPSYDTMGQFKIVRTVWDVLAGRYESMELGSLSVTLAQALGITGGADTTNTNSNALLKSGGTMTGQILTSFKNSVVPGSYQAEATTVPDLVEEVRYSSGCMGSANITTAYTLDGITIPTGWYNFLYVPHRSGGVNGQASGDNCNYGQCMLWAMTSSSGVYSIRFSNSAIADLQYAAYLKYTRNSTGGLDWTNQAEGDSKLLAKSALAFWNGSYDGTTSNIQRLNGTVYIGGTQLQDFIKEKGLSDSWYYRKWNSGKVEAWRTYNAGSQTPSQWVTGWYYKDFTVAIPSGIFSSAPNTTIATNNGSDTQFMVFTARATSTTSISVRVVKPNSGAATPVIALYVCNMV